MNRAELGGHGWTCYMRHLAVVGTRHGHSDDGSWVAGLTGARRLGLLDAAKSGTVKVNGGIFIFAL